MNIKNHLLPGMLLLTILLSSCATLDPDWEQPTVVLSSFKTVPSEGMVPAFEVGLRIMNPNTTELDMTGVVYTISLQGRELVKGVGKDFPVIESFSEGEIVLSASPNLLAGVQLIRDMMDSPEETMELEFNARINLSGLQPTIRVSEKIDFNTRESRGSVIPE